MLMACGAGALPPCPEKLGFLNFDNSGIAGEGWQTDVLWRKCSPQACVCARGWEPCRSGDWNAHARVARSLPAVREAW